jgi:hypothetical protein
MGTDGLAVMIVVEPDMIRIHQDFADAAHTKPIPPSLLAAYNMREPVNRVLQRIVNESGFLQGRVDESSKTLGKLSRSIFLLNQVRGLMKELLVGDFSVTDGAFVKAAAEQLGTAEQQETFVQQSLQLLNVLEAKMDPWNKIRSFPKTGGVANQIPELRQKYLNLTATGLVIIGRVAFEINKREHEVDRVQAYSDLATKVDWRRSAPLGEPALIWKGSVITDDGKLITHKAAIKMAASRVMTHLRPKVKDNSSGE